MSLKMSQQKEKRNRSVNWDEEEKQLLRVIMKDYSNIIENKSLKTNTNKSKTKAWEELHVKFNELNCRPRDIGQLQIQWKTMKLNARKNCAQFKREVIKTGGGPKPSSPTKEDIEIIDLLNPGELTTDFNIYDSDGSAPIVFPSTSTKELIDDDITIMVVQDVEESKDYDHNILFNASKNVEKVNPFNTADTDISTPLIQKKDSTIELLNITEEQTQISPCIKTKSITKKISTPQNQSDVLKPKRLFKKNKDSNYVNEILSHSKTLKDLEYQRRMEMAEEEHNIKMKIEEEKLKCIQIERQILELRFKREQALVDKET